MLYIGIAFIVSLRINNCIMEKSKILTERLIVRIPEKEDINDIFLMMSDEYTAINTGFRPMSNPSEAEGKIRRGIENHNMFVIALKETPSNVIGMIEYSIMTRASSSLVDNDYELCYFMNEEFRGRGYMTEAVDAMKEYLFKKEQASSLIITVFPRNDSSRRVAIKNGFTYKGIERQRGITGYGEIADLEVYIIHRNDFFSENNSNNNLDSIIMAEKQKWINEGGIYYPIPGSATLYSSPGEGIFRIYEDSRLKRLGLEKIDDSFVFDFKIYDLDCDEIMNRIIKTWTSDIFKESNKNLGVIFNGLKGTGKTIAAKILSNRIGLPVVIISKPQEGILEFIQSLNFECVIFIDEAEKTFNEDREVLLKMIDGVYNSKRKLYILTTNRLSVDENLLGRPGRIRYIKEFTNLSTRAINDVIDDNLRDISMKNEVLKLVDTLEISTIDILKSIIDECNIMGEVPSDMVLNVPKAKYKLKVVSFDDLEVCFHEEVKEWFRNHMEIHSTIEDLLMSKVDDINGKTEKRNKELLEEKYDCSIEIQIQPSVSQVPYIGQYINHATVISEPDSLGFFSTESDWDGEVNLLCISHYGGRPSLYKGNLY